MERLDKRLAGTGKWSRKQARALVCAGRVTVDGQTTRSPEEKVGGQAVLTVDGQEVSAPQHTYLMLHKPAGLLSATDDRKQKTVLDLLPEALRRRQLFPVGRLDKDTEGLLLLTNDGPLGHRLLAPKKHVDKTYFLRVEGVLDGNDVKAAAQGMALGDGLLCLPARLEVLDPPDTGKITLHEGKYHQIKRMMAARGKPVRYLKRLTMGPLTLDPALAPGQWRALTAQEEQALLQLE